MIAGALVIHNPAEPDHPQVTAFLINLDKDQARFDWVADQLRRARIALHRVPAVLGSALPAPVIARHRTAGQPALSPPEIGCIESHILAAQTLLDTDLPHGLILEDDVHVAAGAAALIGKLAHHLEDFPVIKLEATPMGIDVETRGVSVGSCCLLALKSSQLGTAAYLVSRRGAEVIAARLATTPLPADITLFTPPFDEFRVGQVMPALFQQDSFTDNPSFPSLMGDRETAMRGERGPVHRMLYPVLVAGYNVINRPKNRKRVTIGYLG